MLERSALVITAGAIPATTVDITAQATATIRTRPIIGLITVIGGGIMVPGTIDITATRIAGLIIGITGAGFTTRAANSQSKKSLS